MSEVATTKMSSKGQVVIPEKIRDSLHLQKGVEFVVVSSGDALILKPILAPSTKQFSALLEKAKKEAQQAGLEKADLDKAIVATRKNK